MRYQLRVAAASLLAVGALQAAPPQRIMSLNLCANQLLLDLVPAQRITSLYFYSRRRDPAFFSAATWRIGINNGTPEQIVHQRPDLVLAGQFTSLDTQRLLKDVGIPVLELAPANNFEDIRRLTLQVGHAVGEDARAQELVRQMDEKLAALARTAPKHPVRIIGWDGGDGSDSVPGQDTLFDAIMRAAGAVDLGAAPGLRSRRFDAEQLLMVRPDLLAYGDATIASPSLRTSPLRQPLIQRLYSGRQIVYPELLYSCGSPQSVDAAAQVRALMLEVLRTRAAPP